MKNIFPAIAVLILSVSVELCPAQKSKADLREEKRQRISAMVKQEEEGVIAYRKQSAFGFKLLNDGYGFFYEAGRAQTVKTAWLFQLEFSERKHPKEEKQTNPVIPTSPFIYGKVNYFYPLKFGAQRQFLFGNKSNKNGVSVTGNFGGGISLGFLRPYYLEVSDAGQFSRRNIKYDSPDSLLFSSNSQLMDLNVSGARFGVGWNEMKINPGIYAKAALRFDYGRYNEMVNALEVGLSSEFYSKKILQVLDSKERQLFLNAFVCIIFGRRK
jgi:hypothetical protein